MSQAPTNVTVGTMDQGKTYYIESAQLANIFGVNADAEVTSHKTESSTIPVVRKGLYLYYTTRLGLPWLKHIF